MKLLLTGDLHLRHNAPKNRMDDFVKTQWRKLSWILKQSEEENCSYILQPGDFYNTWKIPHSLEKVVIDTLKKHKIKIITIFGQHDLRYHSSDKKNTPLAVLEAAKVVTTTKNNAPILLLNTTNTIVNVYGVSWKEEIPTHLKQGINILLMHELIVEESSKGWEKKKTKVHSLFEKTEFDLMVTGDNHKSFAYSDGERHLINCGSLMRTNIDQNEHEPYIYIWDSETNKIKGIPIPIEPFAVVMNVEKAKKEEKESKELGAFVDGLNNEVVLKGLEFKENLYTYNEANKIRKGVVNILDELMDNGGL